jgi:hypothetical protein
MTRTVNTATPPGRRLEQTPAGGGIVPLSGCRISGTVYPFLFGLRSSPGWTAGELRLLMRSAFRFDIETCRRCWGEGKNHCQHRRPGRHQTDPRPFGSTCRPTAAGLQAAGPSAPGQGSRRALRIKAYGLLPLQVRKPCPGGHGHGPSRANPRRAGSLFANENTRPGAHIRPAPSHCKETRDSSKAGTTDFRGQNRTGEC